MNVDYASWTDFKTDILAKGFPYNHQTVRNPDDSLIGYNIFVIDRTIIWQCMINKIEDISDFETNYKSNSNRNTICNMEGIPQSISITTNTPDGSTWMQQTANAEWSKRELHSSVVLPDGSIVIMGGNDGTNNKNDVWRSLDNGVSWAQLTASAGWSPRNGHTSVVATDGSIILAGGIGAIGSLNDVWRSTNKGQNWTRMTASAEWESRYWHSCVALPDGSIVVMGGSGDSIIIANDVWRSTNNGATWTQMTAHAGWTERYYQTSVAMPDGSIILMGGMDTGGTKNDVWKSVDNGTTWGEMTSSAWWSPRYGHTSVVGLDGSITVTGGYDDNGLKNDVWKSANNGEMWVQVTPNAGWATRFNHTAVLLSDGSIVIMGGSPMLNDVWRSTNTQVVQISGQSVFTYISGGSIASSVSGQPVTTSISGNAITTSISGDAVIAKVSGETVVTSISGNEISIQSAIRFATASGYCNTSATKVSVSFTGDHPFTYEGAVVESTTSRWSGNLVLMHTAIVNVAGSPVTMSSFFTQQTISSTTTMVSGYTFVFASGDTHIITFTNTSGGYTTSGYTLSLRAVYKTL